MDRLDELLHHVERIMADQSRRIRKLEKLLKIVEIDLRTAGLDDTADQLVAHLRRDDLC